MKKVILYNTTAQLLAKVVSLSLTAFSTILITRAFGKEGYGQFSIMQTLPALFYILSDFGLNATALKKMSRKEENSQKYYRTALNLRLLLSLIFIVVLNTTVLFLPYSSFLKAGIVMSSLLILTQSLFSGTNLVFQYKQRYDLSAIGYTAGSVVTVVLVLIFIKIGLDVRLLSFSYVIGGVVTFFLNAGILKKLGVTTIPTSKENLISSASFTKDLVTGSIPLGLMFVFSQINFKADSVLLSLLRLPDSMGLSNISSVATYALPYKIFEVSLAIPTFIMNATYPVFVNMYKENRQVFKTFFLRTVKYLTLLGITASSLLYLLAPLAVNILGGREFSQSVEVLRILSIGLLAFFITQPLSYLIVTLDKQKYLPGIYLVGATFNVGANLIFIPRYNFYASAYITWLSEGLILILLIYFAIKSWRKSQNANV